MQLFDKLTQVIGTQSLGWQILSFKFLICTQAFYIMYDIWILIKSIEWVGLLILNLFHGVVLTFVASIYFFFYKLLVQIGLE